MGKVSRLCHVEGVIEGARGSQEVVPIMLSGSTRPKNDTSRRMLTETEVDTNCTPPSFGSTIIGAYSVARDSGSRLLVTFVKNQRNPLSFESQTSILHRIDTSGNVSLVSFTTTRSFLSSVFRPIVCTY